MYICVYVCVCMSMNECMPAFLSITITLYHETDHHRSAMPVPTSLYPILSSPPIFHLLCFFFFPHHLHNIPHPTSHTSSISPSRLSVQRPTSTHPLRPSHSFAHHLNSPFHSQASGSQTQPSQVPNHNPWGIRLGRVRGGRCRLWGDRLLCGGLVGFVDLGEDEQ